MFENYEEEPNEQEWEMLQHAWLAMETAQSADWSEGTAKGKASPEAPQLEAVFRDLCKRFLMEPETVHRIFCTVGDLGLIKDVGGG